MTDTTPDAAAHPAPQGDAASADGPDVDLDTRAQLQQLSTEIHKGVVGQDAAVTSLVVALLCRGHVLLEGVPGVAKTLLVRSLAAALDVRMRRVQFTPDMMPGDITGSLVYDNASSDLVFREGPVFTNLLLADEINRTPPKTQSALLEAMEERQVTVDGASRPLPDPFLVVATQNPIEFDGTYTLPEAQLDRFLMKTSIGYPDHASSVQILQGSALRDRSKQLTPRISLQAVNDMTQLASTVHVDPAVLEYVSRLMEETRLAPEVRVGVSIRGALALMRTVKVWAAVNGRHYVIPDDVKALVEPVWLHRFVLDPEAEFAGTTAKSVMTKILSEVAPPQARQQTA